MKWIDHATDVEKRVQEKMKEDPTYQEPWMPGVSWRSEDFKWRVQCDDRSKPSDQWTWSVFDMRCVSKPWGPKDGGDGMPVPCVVGAVSLQWALALGNLCAHSKMARALLASMKWSAESLRGLSKFLQREIEG